MSIDTDLSCWVTSLSIKALGEDLEDKTFFIERIKRNAFAFRHPFTGAKEGGWGWSDLPGSVPDADDTSGALVALHVLTGGTYSEEVGKGVEWLLALQMRMGECLLFVKVGENSLSTGVVPISLRIHFWLSSFGWMRSLRN